MIAGPDGRPSPLASPPIRHERTRTAGAADRRRPRPAHASHHAVGPAADEPEAARACRAGPARQDGAEARSAHTAGRRQPDLARQLRGALREDGRAGREGHVPGPVRSVRRRAPHQRHGGHGQAGTRHPARRGLGTGSVDGRQAAPRRARCARASLLRAGAWRRSAHDLPRHHARRHAHGQGPATARAAAGRRRRQARHVPGRRRRHVGRRRDGAARRRNRPTRRSAWTT